MVEQRQEKIRQTLIRLDKAPLFMLKKIRAKYHVLEILVFMTL